MSKTKTAIVAQDVYTGEMMTILVPTASEVQVPILTEKHYDFVNLDVQDRSLTVLTDAGEEKYFRMNNQQVLDEFVKVVENNSSSTQDRSLIVTTLCTMGREEPKSIHYLEDDDECC